MTIEKNIYLDMDGTFVDFYGVEKWLDYLINNDTTPYKIASPLFNMNSFAKQLNKMIKKGWTINIISWGSKNCGKDYLKQIEKAKNKWIKQHLKSVNFSKIEILPYGTNKSINKNGILFDDEKQNRQSWECGLAFDEKNIIEKLKFLEKIF